MSPRSPQSGTSLSPRACSPSPTKSPATLPTIRIPTSSTPPSIRCPDRPEPRSYPCGMVKRFFLTALLLMSLPAVLAQGNPANAETEVRDTLAKFVRAFDNLDWDGFCAFFDDNATVFYPRAFPERANGRGQFEKTFKT